MLPIFGRSQGAKRRLDGVAGSPSPRKPQCYGQAWRHREGRKVAPPWWEERVPPLSRRELFGAPWKGEGPLPLMGVAPQLQPLQGMLLRRSTDIYPKELARDMREFFNSLLSDNAHSAMDSKICEVSAGRFLAAMSSSSPAFILPAGQAVSTSLAVSP